MCNLYSHTRSQEAMRQLFLPLGLEDHLGNLPSLPEIYPDQRAPIIRTRDGGREMVTARWGLPTPPQFLIGKKTDRGVTNVRNTRSPHWRRWLAPLHRCLVPFTAFAEPAGGRQVWFEVADGAPACFAGIQVPAWRSVRRLKDGETVDDLFGFLTTDANAEMAAVHPKAMPVILTTVVAWETWLTASWDEAAHLQRPLPDGALKQVPGEAAL